MNTIVTRFVRAMLVVSAGAGILAGCKHDKPLGKISFTSPLPEGQVALRKIPESEYPDFTMAMSNMDDLLRSCDMSIVYLQKPVSLKYYPYLDITHDRAIASVNALKAIALDVKQGHRSPEYVNGMVRKLFDVYKSKGAPSPDSNGFTDKVLFTGYFTPIYDASPTRQGAFQYPLYKRPADLKTDPKTGEVTEKYLTRRQIESSNKLAGQEIAFVKSRWEAYQITIQGSAQLRMPDANLVEIGWDGYNGYEYTSPGEAMKKDGVITQAQHSGKGLQAFFEANPAMADKYLGINERYVFFKPTIGGPYGALNVPVTSKASIAVDKKPDPTKNIYPRAMAAFLSVPVPADESGRTVDFRGFMMDQDTGGAIRAAGRCDIYMGVGPEAEKIAGHQLHEGALYYIALKPEYIAKYVLPISSTNNNYMAAPANSGQINATTPGARKL